MSSRLVRESSSVVAAIIAAFTIGVFYVLQNYGPESTVRRFHNAVAAKDLNELAQVVKEEVTSPAVSQLAVRALTINENAKSVQLYSSGRKSREVLVVAEYQAKNGYRFNLPWLVEKGKGSYWRVNATGTLLLMDRYGRF